MINWSSLSFLWSWVFWLIFAFLVVGVTFGSLYFRKKRKYTYPCLVLNNIGSGKLGVEKKKAGWFKTNKLLFGLIDHSGERRLEVNDGRIVQQGSTQDFHEIGFKRGLIVRAKDDDPKVLVPIKRAEIKNGELLESIAPADYRDASEKIMREAQKETISNMERIMTIVGFMLIVIVLFICIILVIQFANNNIQEANKILDEALKAKQDIANKINVQPAPTAK